MELPVAVALLLVGILCIVKGGDFFVDAASWMAEVSGIPKLIVGATVVSIATTLPELMVSTLAAAAGKTEMAVGNAVGSVTANVGLIMGIALICIPSVIERRDYLLKSILMLGASLYLFAVCIPGELVFLAGTALLAIFAVAMGDNVRAARKAIVLSAVSREEKVESRPTGREAAVNTAKFVVGAAGIVVGAQLLVDNGSAIARMLGVPERIIGVTIIAVGTSLPELVTTLTAIAKKQASLSAGNIIGANIIDMTLILPLCSLISGGSLPVAQQAVWLDIPISFVVGAVALIPALITKRFHRWQGVVLLVIYGVYLTLTCTR